nr:RNA-dependent RNA polymerase [Erysiphe necator associated mitovirus 3]
MRGVDNTIQRIKDSKLHITRYMCGQALYSSINPSVGINKKGLPIWIGTEMNKLADGDKWEKRLLLTLLSVSRALPGSQYIPPLSSLSDKPTYKEDKISEYISYIPMVMQMMNIPSKINVKWRQFHLTTKKGPNGQAMVSSIRDAHLLDDGMLKDIRTVAGDEIIEVINHCRELDPESVEVVAKSMVKPSTATLNEDKGMDKPSTLLRKLSIVHAPERKSRIIAILDYWTQSSLKPLHDRIFSILKGIEQDYTFNQQGVNKRLRKGPFYSLDLSSATDRFPLVFQQKVVEMLTCKEYSEAWSRLLVNKEFYVPWSDSFINYSCGQPMGAYSSWSVFTLSHHITVRIAALMVGIPYFDQYAILGDDIVIANSLVTKKYKEIISDLGVSISEAKSHESSNTYEFAKRWYVNSVEVTGAQINAFMTKSTVWSTLINEYKEICSKWQIREFETEARIIYDLFLIFFPDVSEAFRDRLVRKARIFLSLPWRREGTSASEQILQFVLLTNASALGCFNSSTRRAKEFFVSSMAEIKARELNGGLIKTNGLINDLVKKFKYLLINYKGHNHHEALKAIPFVRLILDQRVDIMNSVDLLQDASALTAEDIVLDYKQKAPISTFDPTKILTKRTHELILNRDATIVNQYSRWIKDYNVIKQNVLNNSCDENTERAWARKCFRTATIGAVMPGFPL